MKRGAVAIETVATVYHISKADLTELMSTQERLNELERAMKNARTLRLLSQEALANVKLIAESSVWTVFAHRAENFIGSSLVQDIVLFLCETWAAFAQTDAVYREGFEQIQVKLENISLPIHNEALLRKLLRSAYVRESMEHLFQQTLEAYEPFIWKKIDPKIWKGPLNHGDFLEVSLELIGLRLDDYTRDLLRAELKRRSSEGTLEHSIQLWHHAISHGFESLARQIAQEKLEEFQHLLSVPNLTLLDAALDRLPSSLPDLYLVIEYERREQMIDEFLESASPTQLAEFIDVNHGKRRMFQARVRALELLTKQIPPRE